MFNDFRSYLDFLETKGKLCRVKKEINIRHEIAAGIRKVSDTDGPALLFENIKGFPNWRVAGGVYATQKLIALALGLPMDVDEEKITQRYLEFSDKRVKPKLVSSGPVKEVIIKGDDVDLSKVPIPTYSELDCAPYLTAGVEVAKHPDTGKQNASIHRRIPLSKNTTSLQAPPPQQLGMMIQAAEEKGQGLGVATVLGAPPELTIASQLNAPMGVDETEIAGAIRGKPIEVVKCETIDVEVPASAEVVIEGVTVPGEKADDGPFGEVVGTYGVTWYGPRNLSKWAFVVKVTAITMRRDPIFQALLTGMPLTENSCVKKWALAASVYRASAPVVPNVEDIKAVNVTKGGGATHHVVVAIHKRAEGTARDIIYTLLTHRLMLWRVIVVDEDVDVYDPVQVEWAVMSRAQIAKDLHIMPPQGGAEPDPFNTNRWGIDATAPLVNKKYDWVRVPGVDKVDYV
jgi:2,5-furandicarboxylate decarboxylase 1